MHTVGSTFECWRWCLIRDGSARKALISFVFFVCTIVVQLQILAVKCRKLESNIFIDFNVNFATGVCLFRELVSDSVGIGAVW